jgi:hypothetical protein
MLRWAYTLTMGADWDVLYPDLLRISVKLIAYFGPS